jgi:hypothetical protein
MHAARRLLTMAGMHSGCGFGLTFSATHVLVSFEMNEVAAQLPIFMPQDETRAEIAARVDREQLRALGRLRDIAMEFAEGLRSRAAQAPVKPEPEPNPNPKGRRRMASAISALVSPGSRAPFTGS